MGANKLAATVSPALAKRLSNPFRYSESDAAKISSFCIPSDNWVDQYPAEIVDEFGSADLMAINILERCADRFLNFEEARPASKVEQRDYLKSLDYHLTATFQLLAGSKTMDATTADPFKFLERVSSSKGTAVSAWQHRDRILQDLLPLQLFARWRLSTDLKPSENEREEEEAKRRRTFPRFCYLADLLAAYQRITGKEPGISLHEGKASEPLEFVLAAANPALRLAKKGIMDAETAKKETLSIKALWRKGIRPELTYMTPDWGKHNERKSIGI